MAHPPSNNPPFVKRKIKWIINILLCSLMNSLFMFFLKNLLDFVKYGKTIRCHLFYGIKLISVLLMQKGKLKTHNVWNFLINITWAQHYYTLLLTINWWKKWIDFVKIKFYSNENIEWHSHAIWIELNSNSQM